MRRIMLTSLAAFLILGTTVITAQDVELIDSDGKPVGQNVLDAKPAAVVTDQEKPDQANSDQAKTSQVATIIQRDGKLIVTQDDGTQQEIDVSDAQSVMVSQSVSSVINNGEHEIKRSTKAVIIDANGQRQEIEINQPLGPEGDRGAATVLNRTLEKSYAIGVTCDPLSEVLASQLNLEPGAGLVINRIGSDSPAEKSGLQVHDILVYADDSELKDISHLLAAVQRAGKENSAISMTVIRGGKEMGVEITPEVSQQRMTDHFPNLVEMPEFGFREIEEQGIIEDDVQAIRDRIQRQVQEMQAELEK